MRKSRLKMKAPVRRKLLAGSIAYLAGVYAVLAVCIPDYIVWSFCVFFLCLGVYCLRHRRSALLFMLAFLFLFGNWRAGSELRMRDEETGPGVLISGTVAAMESGARVRLTDVTIDTERTLNRDAMVTLMTEEDEQGNPVSPAQSVAVGQRITGTGRLFEQDAARNPGGVNWRINALCKGYDLSGYILPGWQAEGEPRFSVTEAFRLARENLFQRIETLFGNHAPLFQAVIIGDKADMDGNLVQAMRLTGIVHILTISGMHMSLMAQALHAITSKLSMSRRSRFCLQAVLLGGFAYLTGCAIGTIRAYIMAMLREFASVSGRRYEPLSSLGAAALIITLVHPLWALSASFQFSFFVVLGILLLSGQFSAPVRHAKRCPEFVRRAVQALALTVSAQFASTPMQLMYYGYIPLLATPMNLLSGALMPVIMLGGWGALLASFVSPWAARHLAGTLGVFAGVLERLSVAAAERPWGILRLPAPYGITLLLVLALLFALSSQVYIGKRRRTICTALAAALLLLYLPKFDPTARYVQLDVGQGDGAVIRKDRRTVLIDVGPESEYAALRYLRHEGLFVDLVILSHADEDHAGALGTLLDSEVRVSRIALPTGALDDVGSQAVADALTKAEELGVSIEFYECGDEILAGGITFSVLSPDDTMSGSNERSLALYADVGGIRLLTLGDLPEDCEMEEAPGCDILKVAHHGSRYATSRALIEQAAPDIAVISVGRNSYGHPSDRVLEDLVSAGADVYRTDQSGCLTFRRGENGLIVTPYIKQ